MTITEIRRALDYFTPGVLDLNTGATTAAIATAESQLGVIFSPSYRRALATFNGGYLLDEALLGVPPIHPGLDAVGATRHARASWGSAGWEERYVQVGDDGCGNPFVLMVDRRDGRPESPVGLFDAETMRVTEIVASSYMHFVWFLIHDAQWHHHPDGLPIPRRPVVWTKQRVVVRERDLSPWRFNEQWMVANDPGLVRWLGAGLSASRA